MHIVRTLVLLASCPLALGCSQTADLLTPDAGIDAGAEIDAATPDAATDMEDAGSDAGPPPPTYGTLCTEDADCEALCDGYGPECVPRCDWMGRCGTACGLSSVCPGEESICLVGPTGEGVCAAPCDPAAPDPCVAWGMGCYFNPDGHSMCVPGCTEDADCSEGRLCQRTWLGGKCFRPVARVGDACEVRTDHQSDCNDRSFCISASEDETAGICVATAYEGSEGAFICRQDDAVHSRVLSHGTEVDVCVPVCEVDADCAPGFVCQDALGEGRGCVPPVSE